MLVPALLQTSLILWMAQQTLQGGVKPQSVSWGRVLPARGVGIGVKPGVAGALGALGSRYGAKAAMKSGLGRYPGAQHGVGGYRSLGLGGRTGLKPGGYGTPGAYGASLGTGLGTGLTNGLGLGLGQGAKRAYGAGVGSLPGYGGLAGIGYPGARQGVSTEDLGGPAMAHLGQALQDLKREKSRALGPSYGKRERTLGPEMPDMRRTNILGGTTPELQTETGFKPAALPPGREVKSLDPIVKSPFDKESKHLAVSQAQRRESYEPMIPERRGTTGHEASLAAGGVRRQLPLDKDIRSLSSASQLQRARDFDLSSQQNQKAKNCGSARDLSGVLDVNRRELLGSETQRSQLQVGKDSRHLGHAQTEEVGGNVFSPPQGQGTYLSGTADGQGVKDLVAKDMQRPRIHGVVAVENPGRGSLNLQVQRGGKYEPVIPGEAQSLGIASIGRQQGKGLTVDGQEAKPLSHAEHGVPKSKAVSIPGQTGRNTQASSYLGGAGNYLGASLGAGGYGAGLGQGAYLGGAAGKLGGYDGGATGYLGAVAGNGFGGEPGAKALSTGYGNGYGDGYGAGLGYPAELADGAESKAGKSQALGTGAYAGQVQGAYGLETTGGKYGGGAAQVPYGNAPVIPTGLEGDGGYPYPAQQLALGAEGPKTANKYGAGVGYGAQQTGYGAALGATQDGLGEQAGKYGGVNGALGNGYKG